MFFSRTITAPTLARRQVERSATWRVMVMKYSSQLGRSLIASPHDPDRLRYERENQHYQARHRRHQSCGAEPAPVIERRRVTEARHEGDHRGPEDPPGPRADAEPQEPDGERSREHRRPAS